MGNTNEWVRIRRCTFRVQDRKAIVEGAKVEPGRVTLFLQSERTFVEGEPVLAEVGIEGDERPPLVLAGTVLWRRGVTGYEDEPPGVCLVFTETEQEPALRLLVRARENPASVAMRRHPRFPIALPVRVHDGRGWREGRIATLSLGGAQLVGLGSHPRRGTCVHVKLVPRLFAPKLRAEVVWQGPDERAGVGVRFLPSTRRAQRQLWDTVRAAAMRKT
jgi:hypothetical protein